jgi:hypothetical protein
MSGQPKKLNVEIASTVLANHRRELFARLLVQRFTEVDAYEKAGYKQRLLQQVHLCAAMTRGAHSQQ